MKYRLYDFDKQTFNKNTVKEGNFEHFWDCTFFVEYNFIHLKA